MAETAAETPATPETPAPRHPDIQVVTPENFDAYAERKVKEIRGEQVEEPPAEPEAKLEAKPEKPAKKKNGIQERFGEVTADRKAAEERAAKLEADLAAERAARAKAEEEREALKAKYEPPKTEEPLGEEPKPEQFKDVTEYSKALKDWTAEKTRRDDAAEQQKQAREREIAETQKAWNERLAHARQEIEDFDEIVGAAQHVKVSDQVRDALVESEAGPQIIYELAKDPALAEKIGKMSVGRALKEIGRMEARLLKDAEPAAAPEKAQTAARTSAAEISKAPAPIRPLAGANAPAANLRGSDEVPKSMSYEDWKALRRAGKIH